MEYYEDTQSWTAGEFEVYKSEIDKEINIPY